MQIIHVKDLTPEMINQKLSYRDFTGGDLSEISDSDWLDGLYIVRSCLPARLPGAKTIPLAFKGKFVQCNVDNHELHADCEAVGGDGLESSNIHYIVANNHAPFLTDKSSNYTELITNLYADEFIAIGLDPSPEAVPSQRADESVLQKAHRMLQYAKENNIHFFDVDGEILENTDFSVLFQEGG